jgi:hypothetical protein
MVRFRQPDQAQELLQAYAAAGEAGEPKQVAGCAAELRLVEGQEEVQYYKRVSGCGVLCCCLVGSCTNTACGFRCSCCCIRNVCPCS